MLFRSPLWVYGVGDHFSDGRLHNVPWEDRREETGFGVLLLPPASGTRPQWVPGSSTRYPHRIQSNLKNNGGGWDRTSVPWHRQDLDRSKRHLRFKAYIFSSLSSDAFTRRSLACKFVSSQRSNLRKGLMDAIFQKIHAPSFLKIQSNRRCSPTGKYI